MVSRVAILPSRGDPVTLMLAYHFFEKVWQDEVNRLLILVNSPVEKEVIDFIRGYVTRNPKVVFLYVDRPLDHGPALTQMFHASNEDLVVFVEDDSIIFKKDIVSRYCGMVEDGIYDCIGSPRWSCTNGLMNEVRLKFSLSDFAYQVGGNFWPCFFFARRSDLLRTDLNFAGKIFKAGEYVTPLRWEPDTDQAGDTFVWMSIQLRALNLKFLEVEQYHGNDGDLNAYKDRTSIFDGTCPWLHNGTLSSAIYDIFTDGNNIPLAYRKQPGAIVPNPALMCGRGEIERRLSWALLAINRFWHELEPIAEFRDLYKKAIQKYIMKFNLNIARMDYSAKIYKELIGL